MSKQSLLKRVMRDYPEFSFCSGRKYAFRPPKYIMIGPEMPKFADLLLLHELSHAILKHRSYITGVSRLKMETEAWTKAKELARQYDVPLDENFIEEELDTYRNWLHNKTLCKKCGLTCYQSSDDGSLHCPQCENFNVKKRLR